MLQIQLQVTQTRNRIPKILILISLSVLMGYALAITYWSTSIQTGGTIIAYGCKVYLDDKTTECCEIHWGEIKVNSTVTQFRWVYNNATDTKISWRSNPPSYLQLRTYYQLTSGAWQTWTSGQTCSFSSGQWLHIKLELTALSDSVNNPGTFQFKIYMELI